MLTEILLVVLVLIALAAVYVATRPAQFTVTRSATMAAPASAPYRLINDFHEWTHWSPWEHRDPNLKRTYEGPSSGVGAVYKWEGDRNVGQGMMKILESRPNEAIRIHLEFIKPFKAVNTTNFEFKGNGGQTTVVWMMHGNNNFMGKLMSVFMNMDKMIGGDFEKGLADMKTAAEKSKSS